MPRIEFAPGLELDSLQAPHLVMVKGESPHLDYPFNLLEIYAQVPSLDLRRTYERIRRELGRGEHILCHELKLRPRRCLPEAQDEAEACAIMAAVFDPGRYSLGDIG